MATTKSSIIVKKTAKVNIQDLTTYGKNPRIGDIDLIAESLEKTGQFRPILVNARDNQVLAGNHTYLAARKLGWTQIYASFVDVDEDVAKRIVLADNKTADAGTYDDSVLTELLESLPDITGTGFNQEEVDALLSSITEDVAEQVEGLTSLDGVEEQPQEEKYDQGVDDFGDAEEDEGDNIDVRQQSMELEGSFSLKMPEEMSFDGVGEWEMPRIRTDMLMTWDELPQNLKAWAGSATKDWPDEDQWWLYNWGIDSTSGMKDVSKVIISFYAYDDYFEGWYDAPDKFVAKALNSKIKYILTPDFSQSTDEPRCLSLHQLYKARFLGRYFQECGLKIIPHIAGRDGDIEWLKKEVLATLPVGMPLIALQMQTIDEKTMTGGIETYKEYIRTIFEVLKPEAALIYVGKQAQPIIDECVPKEVKLMLVESRMYALAEQAKQRQKKTGI